MYIYIIYILEGPAKKYVSDASYVCYYVLCVPVIAYSLKFLACPQLTTAALHHFITPIIL
jgi:hypothetical protein